MSERYRGRVNCESYVITCFTDRRPVPPGPNGSRCFEKAHMLEEGVKIMKEVEDYEFQRLALKIDVNRIGDEFKVGKLVKRFITQGMSLN